MNITERIVLRLASSGPMTAGELARDLSHPQHATKRAIVDLVAAGRVHVSSSHRCQGGRRYRYALGEKPAPAVPMNDPLYAMQAAARTLTRLERRA